MQYLIILVPWFVGAYFVINGHFTFGALMAISQLNNLVSEPLTQAISSYNEYLGGKEIANKIKENIIINDYKKKISYKMENKFTNLFFENIKFLYNDKIILNNISLPLETGKKYLITGKSGAGKSTLAKVLCGLLPPCEGKIFINGHSIDYTKYDMINICTYAPQETFLFNDSIYNNITLYNDVNDSDVDNLLNNLQLSTVFGSSVECKNIIIGENGKKISGGQKQRIGIARAFLSDAPVIIFD
jgi:ATP-binding cassette subfamily B protein